MFKLLEILKTRDTLLILLFTLLILFYLPKYFFNSFFIFFRATIPKNVFWIFPNSFSLRDMLFNFAVGDTHAAPLPSESRSLLSPRSGWTGLLQDTRPHGAHVKVWTTTYRPGVDVPAT